MATLNITSAACAMCCIGASTARCARIKPAAWRIDGQPMARVDGEDVAARRVREVAPYSGWPRMVTETLEARARRADDTPHDPGDRDDVDGVRRDAGLRNGSVSNKNDGAS
ncbi:MAG: hypothetical protein IPG04_04970 [Polyangiaceae bacterium]|nr:hypothetical protein [Polyangiaceae bacterium]